MASKQKPETKFKRPAALGNAANGVSLSRRSVDHDLADFERMREELAEQELQTTAELRALQRRVVEQWRALELPESIAAWQESLPANGNSAIYFRRAERFIQHCNADQTHAQVSKDWQLVRARARAEQDASDPPELSVFLGLPDSLEYNPNSLVYGGRRLSRGLLRLEVERYARARVQVEEVVTLLADQNFLRDLFHDAAPTPAAYAAACALQPDAHKIGHALPALRQLAAVLREIDPRDKVPTKEPYGDGAVIAIFASTLAALNRHLPKPRHEAIVRLAVINCPAAKAVTAAQVTKAWNRADKNR
jgi:hypothetical protein